MISQHYAALPLPKNKVLSNENKSIKSLPADIPVQSVIHNQIPTARVSPPKKMEHIIKKSLHTAFHKPVYDNKPTIKSAKIEHHPPIARYVYHEALIPVIEKPRSIEAPITLNDGPAVIGNYPYDEEPAEDSFGG